MYIKALRSVSLGGGKALGVGEIVDVGTDVAALLISMGKAARAEAPRSPAPVPVVIETASVAPNRGATKVKKH